MWTFNDQSIVKKNHMDILWHKYADKSEEKRLSTLTFRLRHLSLGELDL
ncbi:MAG: hypothetical protein ACLUD0_03145 [Eubacterium ramulus]